MLAKAEKKDWEKGLKNQNHTCGKCGKASKYVGAKAPSICGHCGSKEVKEVEKAELLEKPPVSESQRRAMGAAASGKSNLDIPKKVGKEFAKADKGGKLPKRKKKRL